MSALRFHFLRLVAHHAVRELAPIAEKRAAAARHLRGAAKVWPLSDREVEALIEPDFLARLATTMRPS
jgi:hypothetical protein